MSDVLSSWMVSSTIRNREIVYSAVLSFSPICDVYTHIYINIFVIFIKILKILKAMCIYICIELGSLPKYMERTNVSMEDANLFRF